MIPPARSFATRDAFLAFLREREERDARARRRMLDAGGRFDPAVRRDWRDTVPVPRASAVFAKRLP